MPGVSIIRRQKFKNTISWQKTFGDDQNRCLFARITIEGHFEKERVCFLTAQSFTSQSNILSRVQSARSRLPESHWGMSAMSTSLTASRLLTILIFLVLGGLNVSAADPGLPLPGNTEISDQKTGSVLIYNFYTSSVATPAVENTRFTITNTNASSNIPVKLYFVDGTDGSVNEFTICLTQNQTATFLASDFDPGVRGFLIAVAFGFSGCPDNFNFLAGEGYVKLATGHTANLPALALAALTSSPTSCTPGANAATLNFDGVNYNRLPRTLALEKVRSPVSGNSMLLVLNRIGGNLTSGGTPILGTINGELIDDLGADFPFNFTANSTQLVSILSDGFPLTTPVFSSVIPASRTGWLTLYDNIGDKGLTGAQINFNPGVALNADAFKSGHNLRALTLSSANSLILPITSLACF